MHLTIEQFLARGPRLPKSVAPGRLVPKGALGIPLPPRAIALPGGRGAYHPGGGKPRGIKSTKVYEAAERVGFRYPNQFKESGPKDFHVAKHAKPGVVTIRT